MGEEEKEIKGIGFGRERDGRKKKGNREGGREERKVGEKERLTMILPNGLKWS